MAKILVTGGAGYIGSHTCLELLEQGYDVVVVDDLSNASLESLRRVEQLSGKSLVFHEVSLLDRDALRAVFKKEGELDAVIHFAAKKSVKESVENPLLYYQNNITGSLVLCEVMQEFGLSRIVFSSSATVYGTNGEMPLREGAQTGAVNPYGQTKLMMEQILKDVGGVNAWDVVLLRYFNPVGAHASGQIGEDPEYPFNLLPFVSQVAAGLREEVSIFGDDYDTEDGTGVRDYIHVVDLAKAHVQAIANILTKEFEGKSGSKGETLTYNLGTGRGYSVKEMIEAFRRISGKEVKAVVQPRREGDVAVSIADPTYSNEHLGWKAELGLDEMVRSAWKWQTQHPKGYRS